MDKPLRGKTHTLPSGDKVRAGRLPSGESYVARKASKQTQKMGAPSFAAKQRGISGTYTKTRATPKSAAVKGYKPIAGLRNSGHKVLGVKPFHKKK